MNIEVFILAHFDEYPLCLTNGRPQSRTFDGVEYVFTNQLVKVRLPEREMSALDSAIRNQKISVEFFDKSRTPGASLSGSARMQGRLVEVFVFDGTTEMLSFRGEIDSFSYDVEECTCAFTASAQRKSTEIVFPPGSLLEEGRFVERRVLDTSNFQQTPVGLGRQQYLAPTVSFYHPTFGTPQAPNGPYVFAEQQIEYYPGRVEAADGAYLFFGDRPSDLAVPVVYGENVNVALNILGHYRVSDPSSSTMFYKVHIAIVAGHQVIGDPDRFGSGGDFNVNLTFGYKSLDNLYGGYNVDGLNSDFSYLAIPVLYTDAQYENLSPDFPSNFDIYQAFIPRLAGKRSVGLSPISGLSDVISDMWSSYGGGGAANVDWREVSRSAEQLNSFEVSAVFNDKQAGQTLLKILTERFESQFPVAFGFPLGMLAWQAIVFKSPSALPDPAAEIVMGVNGLGRGDVSQTSIKSILNNVKLSYGINGNSGTDGFTLALNSDNCEIAKVSKERWGESDLSEIKVQDTSSFDTAVQVGLNRIMRSGGVRYVASYDVDETHFLSLPFLSIVSVTDEVCGFDEEPFYFVGYKWGKKLATFSVSLLSVRMV